jgi:hypothetical protein
MQDHLLLSTDKLHVRRLHLARDIHLHPEETMEVWVCSAGAGTIRFSCGREEAIGILDTFVIPASSEGAMVFPDEEELEFIIARRPLLSAAGKEAVSPK